MPTIVDEACNLIFVTEDGFLSLKDARLGFSSGTSSTLGWAVGSSFHLVSLNSLKGIAPQGARRF